ncbi:MAG: hypothetical protein H8E28_09855 [Anaerolineae bacterium]|nr:hypothetical protein [Anaerolineae bacterium]
MKSGNTYHISQALVVALLMCLCALTLSACELDAQSPDALADLASGPNTWIEYPSEGTIFTMGTIPIAVYAASPDGVGSISVTVGGEAIPVGELAPLVNDSTLVRADLLWQPPGEGEYLITASAGGAPTSLRFCVVTCDTPETEPVEQAEPTSTPTATLPIITLAPDEPTWTPTSTPAASFTPTATPASSKTPTATPYKSPTPTAYTESSAEFWAAPPYINAGECTTLNWNVYGNFKKIYFEGNPVNASGSDSECPSASYTYHLQIVEMDNSTTDHWTSVDVYEAPPSDTSGPSINWKNLVWESCQFYGEAGISDESGVSWAQFYYNKNGEGWNSVWMSELSTEYWQSDFGISVDDGMSTPMGTVEYYIVASDSLGNQRQSGTSSYSYTGCDG